MAKAFVNPFDALQVTERVVHIEAFNADVTIRDLTMSESDAFNKRLLKNYDGKGEPSIDMEQATQINYEKVAMALVEPKMTVEALKALGTASASKVMAEIIKAIDGREDVEEDETEGNED